MMRAAKLTLFSLAVLVALALPSAPASAATGYVNLCPSLQTAFCTPGDVPGANYAALDTSNGPSAGDVWIASEGSSPRVLGFDAAGEAFAEIASASFPSSAQPFHSGSYIPGIAVDPRDGSVYISNNYQGEEGTVTKFDHSGVFQLQLTGADTPGGILSPHGVAVDPANGDLYVANSTYRQEGSEEIDKFTPSGEFIERFAVPLAQKEARRQPSYASIAVDSEGVFYLGFEGASSTVAEVRQYGPTGAPLDCASGTNLLYEDPPGAGTSVGAVAIDQSDGHIFIGESSAADGSFIAEYSAPCGPIRARIGVGELPGLGDGGFGVSPITHDIYAGQFFQEHGLVFGQATIPDVTTGASAENVTRAAATLGGVVNPDGLPATVCEFEYGTTIGYGHSVACAQALPLEGSSPVQVSAEIGFSLPPATQLHYRLKAGNANGVNVGEDQTFFTEALPVPVVGGAPASDVSEFAATLNATLRTGEALVDYHFEYGTSTAYGSVAPVPDSYTPIEAGTISVSQPVAGLQAGTAYHYRLIASSPGGTAVRGPDETFTTSSIAAPSVSTGAASAVGVGSATLSGSIDPQGWDTTYLFQYGTSSAYGSSWPTVPVDMGALEGEQPVVVNVPGLLPGRTYHYRLVASNGGGTSYGSDMTFTTGEYPAQVIQEPPTLRTLIVPGGKAATLPASRHKQKKVKRAKKRKRVKQRKRTHRKHA
jgi:hypothetical protein